MPSKWTGRKVMSVMLKPDLQKRLKIRAAEMELNRSELVERFCEQGLREFDWGALQKLRKASR